ncbi:CASP-like protein 4A4 [Nymphaea thermarum]|nr:CASP-like protein 4A4 [Nymphaea thermarum]
MAGINCPLHSRPTAPPDSSIMFLTNLFLRFCALLFSCVALVLLSIAPSQSHGTRCHACLVSSLSRYPQIVVAKALAYSTCQLLKDLYEIAKKKLLVAEVFSDYTTFIIDQLMAYLLVSSCSTLSILASDSAMASDGCRRMVAVALATSLCTFLSLAISAVLSGCKLVRRISGTMGPFQKDAIDCAFFLSDQLAAYLLLSSFSLLIPATKGLVITSPCGRESVAAALLAITFCAFFFVAVRALFSGYRYYANQ